MTEENIEHKDSVTVSKIKRHQLTLFLITSISIAFFMVYIALSLYRSSGTIQLDLSRPGFDQARKEATKTSTTYSGFSPQGTITKKSLEEFDKLYTDRLQDATAIDAFAGDALSDKTLQIGSK